MKKILLMLALASGVASAHAQSADTTAVNDLTLRRISIRSRRTATSITGCPESSPLTG